MPLATAPFASELDLGELSILDAAKVSKQRRFSTQVGRLPELTTHRTQFGLLELRLAQQASR